MGFSKKTYVGLDIGGTKIEGILWQSGRILKAQTISTPKNPKQFWEQVFYFISRLKSDRKISGIGVGIAGAIDFKKGIILNSPNLKFLNRARVKEKLKSRFHVPVRMDNDANCFLLGEATFGQAVGRNNVVGLTLGTGIGGAVLLDGRLVRGIHGAAGELGHTVIAGTPPTPLFNLPKAEGKGEFFTFEDLCSSHGFARLGIGKPKFSNQKVLKIVAKYLGVALANIVNVFDPEMIILGGGIANLGKRLLLPALEEMPEHTLLPKQYFPPVKISRLSHATALGAISLFRK